MLIRIGLVLTRVGLVSIRVDSCWTRIDSCWLVSDSCWFVSDSCWFLLTRFDSCWLALICVDTRVLEQTWSRKTGRSLEVKVNESQYIALFVVSGFVVKKLFSIDSANIYHFSMFFSIDFSVDWANIYLFLISFFQ